MKTKIIIALAALAFLIAGCGESTSSDSTVTTTEATTTEELTLTEDQVEGYFAADRSRKANRVGEQNGGVVSVKSEDCTIVSEGKATCIEKLHYQVGVVEKDETLVWEVRYSEDGEILSYTK